MSDSRKRCNEDHELYMVGRAIECCTRCLEYNGRTRFGRYNPLLEACEKGDLDEVVAVLDHWDNPLITERKDFKVLLPMLRNLRVGDVTDNRKKTVLHIAARRGNLSIVNLLVSRGADVNATNYVEYPTYKTNALTEAVLGGHMHVAEYLILKGADMRSAILCLTPSIRDADDHFKTFLRMCMEQGIDLGVHETGENILCDVLSSYLSRDLGMMLVHQKVDVNARADNEDDHWWETEGGTVMRVAPWRNYPAMAGLSMFLADHGANLNDADSRGNTVSSCYGGKENQAMYKRCAAGEYVCDLLTKNVFMA